MDTNLTNGRAHTHEGDSAFPTAPQWRDMFPGLNLFTDQFGHAWARVPSGDHYENLALKGRLFRNWLIRGMLASAERPSRGRIAERLDTFEAIADTNRHTLHNRSAWVEEGVSLCIDLADESGAHGGGHAVRLGDPLRSAGALPPLRPPESPP